MRIIFNMKYVLIDLERTLFYKERVYWRPNKCGYTTNIEEAGLYTRSEAASIINADFNLHTFALEYNTALNFYI